MRTPIPPTVDSEPPLRCSIAPTSRELAPCRSPTPGSGVPATYRRSGSPQRGERGASDMTSTADVYHLPQFDPRTRRKVCAYVRAGYPPEEIADVIDAGTAATQSLIHRLRREG